MSTELIPVGHQGSASAQAGSAHTGRLPALDGIRGLAILSVMLFHFTLATAHTHFEHLVYGVARNGWIGVDLFFVLSGFLITGILFDAKGSSTYFRHFYARRTLRIFPLYYLLIALFIVLLPLMLSNDGVQRFAPVSGGRLWYWLYLSNFSLSSGPIQPQGVLNHSWSLAIEEEFYLVWPLMVFLLSRRNLMRLCIGLVAAAIATRTAMVIAGVNWMKVAYWTPCRMDTLAIGGWVALAMRGPRGLKPLVPYARIFGILSVLLVLLIPLLQRLLHVQDGPLRNSIGYTCIAMAFGSFTLLVVAAPANSLTVRWLSHPWLMAFGTFSYALYLYHLPIQGIVTHFYPPDKFLIIRGSNLPGQLIFYALTMGISLVVAVLSWHLLEKHFLKLKRHFPVNKESSGANVASEAPDPS